MVYFDLKTLVDEKVLTFKYIWRIFVYFFESKLLKSVN